MKHLTQQQRKHLSEIFQQGQRAIQLGAFGQAEKHFSEILKIDSSIIEAQASLAYVYTASKQHAKATTQLRALLKTNINLAQTHHNLGTSLHEQQLFDEAIYHYQAALKIEPNRVDSLISCAASFRALKNHDAAIKCLHQALGSDKRNANAFHLLGIIYAELEDYPLALNCLHNATGLAPNNAVYRLCFANILERATLDYEAEMQYHQACETNPNYLDAFVLYGTYLLKNHYHDEALECFKQAKNLKPQQVDHFNKLDVLQSIGETYLGMGNTDAAEDSFYSILENDPQHLKALQGLGQAYQDTGRVNDAWNVADKIIAIDNNLHQGYVLKASVKKSNAEDGLAAKLIHCLSPDINDKNKTFIHFALGKIFNDQNNYSEAFKHYAEGNLLVNRSINYDKNVDQAKFSKLIEVFHSSLFSLKSDLGSESNLPVLIVGMPRSGTTLTEQIISSHPKVIGAGEVSFWGTMSGSLPLRMGTETPFPQCVLEMTQDHGHLISKMYESKLRKIAGLATSPAHITDKMPHNFLLLGLIALLFPNVKIIHTKRDPIDTCLSIFSQNFSATGHPYAFDLSNLGFHYKQYERIMKHWHEVLPGRILDINYEDTIADPEYWSRKLIAHIGLEWDDACLAPHKLERSVKTASHWQVRQPIYKTSVQRWKKYEEFLGPLKEALEIAG